MGVWSRAKLSCPQLWGTALPGAGARSVGCWAISSDTRVSKGAQQSSNVLEEQSWPCSSAVTARAGLSLSLYAAQSFLWHSPVGEEEQGKFSFPRRCAQCHHTKPRHKQVCVIPSAISRLQAPLSITHSLSETQHYQADFFYKFILPSAHNNHTRSGSIGLDVPPKELKCPLLREVKIR